MHRGNAKALQVRVSFGGELLQRVVISHFRFHAPSFDLLLPHGQRLSRQPAVEYRAPDLDRVLPPTPLHGFSVRRTDSRIAAIYRSIVRSLIGKSAARIALQPNSDRKLVSTPPLTIGFNWAFIAIAFIVRSVFLSV